MGSQADLAPSRGGSHASRDDGATRCYVGKLGQGGGSGGVEDITNGIAGDVSAAAGYS